MTRSLFRALCGFSRLFVFALIFSLSMPVGADADSKLSAEFIAMSDTPMNWMDAKVFCQRHGGKLPLIGGSEGLAGDSIPRQGSIDGFGSIGASWPTALPMDDYWTGTAVTTFPGRSWYVMADRGRVVVHPDNRGFPVQVYGVCVP